MCGQNTSDLMHRQNTVGSGIGRRFFLHILIGWMVYGFMGFMGRI